MSFFFTGPRHSGRRCVLGRLFYEVGVVRDSEVAKAASELEKRRIDNVDVVKWAMVWQQERNARLVQLRRLIHFAALSDAADGSLGDFHRCLFTANECVLVLSADMHVGQSDWEWQLQSLAMQLKAFNRRPACVIVNKMDLARGARHPPVADMIARAGAILANAGLISVSWTHTSHKAFPPPFRARIFAFLLVRHRLATRLRIPQDVLFLIVKLVAQLDGMLLPVFEFSCAEPRQGQWKPIVALLESRAKVLQQEAENGELVKSPLVMSVFESFRIAGVGAVATGRVVQGMVQPDDEVRLLGTSTAPLLHRVIPRGLVRTVEEFYSSMHADHAHQFVGVNIKGMADLNRYHYGGVLVSDSSPMGNVLGFVARIQMLTMRARLSTTASIYVHCNLYLVQLTEVSEWNDGGNGLMCTFRLMSSSCFVLPFPSDMSYFISYLHGKPWFSGAVLKVEMSASVK